MLLATLGAIALSVGRARSVAAGQPLPPQSTAALTQPISDLDAALLAAMRAGSATPFPERFTTLAPVIERVFDLETVLKASVGLRWMSFDQATRGRLSETFRRFTVASYVANFDKYDGERFVIMPDARAAGLDRVMQTEMRSNTGSARLDYLMRRFGPVWRVVDVLIDGSISRVAVQRADFNAILAKGNADALVDSLRRKVVNLSNGSLAA